MASNTKSLSLVRGSSQRLTIADADQTGLDITTDFTVEFWYNPTNVPSENSDSQFFWYRADADDGIQVTINQNGNLFDVSYESGGTGSTGCDSDSAIVTTADEGEWVHLAVTVDVSSQTFVMYRNGSSVSCNNYSTGSSSVGDPGTVGQISGRPSPANRYIDGKIDEFIIWNDIRTSTEIGESYNSGDGKIYDGDESGMVCYLRMEDNLLDTTTNDNDFTNNNAATFSTDVPFAGGGSPYTLEIDTMALSFTYNDVGLDVARKLPIGTMALDFTFNDVILTGPELILPIDTMALDFTFNDVNFTYKRAYTLVVDTMALDFTFNDVELLTTRDLTLTIDTMALIFTFNDVALRVPGRWTPTSKNTSTWTNVSKN